MKLTFDAYRILLAELYKRNLFSREKYDLSRMKKLLSKLGNPEKALRAIHVGGTNGKGSVTTKIASALQKEGKRVGLFTSPHIACYRERIQIDQRKISQEEVEKHLQKLLLIDPDATFFELTSAMAFLFFAEEKVDFAVIEVGLGGRLDATNVLTPELSVITSIDFDHTEILGNSLDQILEEKKGIIKPPAPCVLGPNVPLFTSEAPLFLVKTKSPFYDEENQEIARLALSCLQKKVPISEESIAYGLSIRPPCRLEWIDKKLVLDVAHNPQGFQALVRALPKGPKLFLLAISSTKNVEKILEVIQPECTYLVFTEAKNGRSYPVDHLKSVACRLGFIQDRIRCEKNPGKAIELARTFACLTVVAGSFFIMKDIQRALGITLDEDPLDLNERF